MNFLKVRKPPDKAGYIDNETRLKCVEAVMSEETPNFRKSWLSSVVTVASRPDNLNLYIREEFLLEHFYKIMNNEMRMSELSEVGSNYEEEVHDASLMDLSFEELRIYENFLRKLTQ